MDVALGLSFHSDPPSTTQTPGKETQDSLILQGANPLLTDSSAEPAWRAGGNGSLGVSDWVELGQSCSWLCPQSLSLFYFTEEDEIEREGFMSHFPICFCHCGMITTAVC